MPLKYWAYDSSKITSYSLIIHLLKFCSLEVFLVPNIFSQMEVKKNHLLLCFNLQAIKKSILSCLVHLSWTRLKTKISKQQYLLSRNSSLCVILTCFSIHSKAFKAYSLWSSLCSLFFFCKVQHMSGLDKIPKMTVYFIKSPFFPSLSLFNKSLI